MTWEHLALYASAAAAIGRATLGLMLHGLARPGRPAILCRDGRLHPR